MVMSMKVMAKEEGKADKILLTSLAEHTSKNLF